MWAGKDRQKQAKTDKQIIPVHAGTLRHLVDLGGTDPVTFVPVIRGADESAKYGANPKGDKHQQ